MKPVLEIINSLEKDSEHWVQMDHTLVNSDRGWQIWTANVPYFDIGIYRPKRKIGFFDKIRLQRAVNRWHKNPLPIVPKQQ